MRNFPRRPLSNLKASRRELRQSLTTAKREVSWITNRES
jgi:hypothetical protein